MSGASAIAVDEAEQSVSALKLAVELIERAQNDPQLWRWVVLVLHQAVQGFMVCALTGSDGTRPLNHRKKEVQEYIQALRGYSQTGQYPDMPAKSLDSFLGLYSKVKDPPMMKQFTTSREFVASRQQDSRIDQLNELRNDFQHFTPKKWLIEVAVLIEPIDAGLELIRFLALDSHNIVWRKFGAKGEAWQQDVKERLNRGRAVLTRL